MPRRDDEISTPELERTLKVLAKLVAGKGGEAYAPLFVRVEEELQARRSASDVRARARALLHSAAA